MLRIWRMRMMCKIWWVGGWVLSPGMRCGIAWSRQKCQAEFSFGWVVLRSGFGLAFALRMALVAFSRALGGHAMHSGTLDGSPYEGYRGRATLMAVFASRPNGI
jgi:hypothetical protein